MPQQSYICGFSDKGFVPSDDHFPILQMMVLASAVFSSAISLSGLFPYVGTYASMAIPTLPTTNPILFGIPGFMVIHLGAADSEDTAGFASGFIASAMMAGRLLSSIYWGRAADTIGRKPCLIIGCFSVAIFSVLFGCADTFAMAIAARLLLGIFNPIWGVAKTLISELCTKNVVSSLNPYPCSCPYPNSNLHPNPNPIANPNPNPNPTLPLTPILKFRSKSRLPWG